VVERRNKMNSVYYNTLLINLFLVFERLRTRPVENLDLYNKMRMFFFARIIINAITFRMGIIMIATYEQNLRFQQPDRRDRDKQHPLRTYKNCLQS